MSKGYYAPVYDPTQNLFYMTDTPVNAASFSGVIDVINAATGSLTQFSVPGQVINGLGEQRGERLRWVGMTLFVTIAGGPSTRCDL